MLTKKQKDEIKEALLSSERPLFFFHDDADGVASFLQFYKQVKRGKGVIVKSTPLVDERFIPTANNFSPDKIFILDLALVSQDFIDSMNVPIYWLDHHDITTTKGTKYYNPKQNKKDDNTCIAKLSYDIFKENFWISAVGTIGDWQLPKTVKTKILKEMPELFDKSIDTPEKALFESKLGKVVKILSFVLKGQMKEVHEAIRVLTRINSAQELLDESTPQAKFLMKRYKMIDCEYERLLNDAIGKADDGPLLVYTYAEHKISLSGELSNQLLYKFPEKVIIIARHHNGEMKVSFRSGKNIKVKEILEKAMVGINGRAGGHPNACGGLIKDTDWDQLISNIKNILGAK